MFLGYHDGMKGFRLWSIEPGTQKLMLRRDVTYNEDLYSFKVKVQNTLIQTCDNREDTSIKVKLPDTH